MSTALNCRVPSDWLADPSICWFEWQAIVAGLLALIAALIGAYFLFGQTMQSEYHRRDELTRQHVAARVALPLTLSSLSETLQHMADEIAFRFERYNQIKVEAGSSVIFMNSGVQPFDTIDLPNGIISSFQQFVQTIDDKDEIRHVAQLVAGLQIFLARYRSFNPQNAVGENALVSLMIDCARVSLLNDKLYNFARFVSDEPFSIMNEANENCWEGIKGKAHSLLFFRDSPDPMMAKINEVIDRFKDADVSPWLEEMGE